MLVSQSRFCRSLFGSVNENLLYEVCYLRLSRGSGTFLFYPVNNVYHSLYHSLYHSFPDTVILISQSCFSSSDHTAVDSALCFVTLRRHCLSLPDFDERLVPPVSSVLLHCSLSVSSLSRRARSGVETGFVLLRGGPDRNRFRNLRSRLPDGFSGASGSGAAGVDTGFAPLWAKPGRNRFRFRRPSLPTNLPRRRGQVHGYCLNSGPTLGANFVARILLIIKCF